MVLRTFLFSPSNIAAIKKALLPRLWDKAMSFDVLAVFLWCACTTVLMLYLDEEARLVTVVNLRRHAATLGLPAGYYGYACVNPTVVIAAGPLLTRPLGDVVQLVWEVKASMTAEYALFMADHLVLRGRPALATANLFLVTDLRRTGFGRVDFGLGELVYGDPAKSMLWVSSLIPVKNGGEEDAVAVPVALPWPAIERFPSEIESLSKV